MRLHRGVAMLAAALTLATTSPVYASEFVSDRYGSGQPVALVQHHSRESGQWILDVGAVGGLVVLATGLAVNRSRTRTLLHRRRGVLTGHLTQNTPTTEHKPE